MCKYIFSKVKDKDYKICDICTRDALIEVEVKNNNNSYFERRCLVHKDNLHFCDYCCELVDTASAVKMLQKSHAEQYTNAIIGEVYTCIGCFFTEIYKDPEVNYPSDNKIYKREFLN